MPLEEETVVVRGRTYTVRELTILEALPLLDAGGGQEGDEPDHALSLALFTAACRDDQGEPLDPSTVGAGVYMRLMPVVNRLNSLGEAEPGNE